MREYRKVAFHWSLNVQALLSSMPSISTGARVRMKSSVTLSMVKVEPKSEVERYADAPTWPLAPRQLKPISLFSVINGCRSAIQDTALHGLLAWMLRSGIPTLAMPKPSEYDANT